MLKTKRQDLPETYLQLSEEILTDLQEKNVTVTHEFVLMMVRVTSLNPENKFLLKHVLEVSEIERIKRVSMEQILSMHPIALKTILLQLHFITNFFSKEEIVGAENKEIEEQMKPTMEYLLNAIPKQKKHKEEYYDKFVLATIAKTGIQISNIWDNRSIEYKIQQQTKAALSSVFPLEDLDLLSALSPENREAGLRNAMQITIGVRLLNKNVDPENMGAGIPNLTVTLTEEVISTLDNLSSLRKRNTDRLVYYTTAIKSFFLNFSSLKQQRHGIGADVIFIRQGLTMIHQLLQYGRVLYDELTNEVSNSKSLIESFNTGIIDLRSNIGDTLSVPTFTVYPKLNELANIWKEIRDSYKFVTNCNELIKAFEEFSEAELQNVDDAVTTKMTVDMVIPTVQEFLSVPEAEVPYDQIQMNNVRRSTFSESKDLIKVEYSGFCLWSLVENVGLPVMSNPSLGVFHWNEKQYMFSSPEALIDFLKDPNKYINKLFLIALKWPELIFLLKIDDDIFIPDVVGKALRAIRDPITLIYADSQVQTDLHPIPQNIVEGYSWNEWEYRRRALILSNVYKSMTHSTQTYIQSVRTSQPSQTYPLKNRKVQTNTSVSTEAPRSQFYFYGLRGYHCSSLGPNPPHIVQLTREPVMDMTVVKYPSPKSIVDLAFAEHLVNQFNQ